MNIGVREAKIELSKLIKAALHGEKVVITNHGRPLVRLVPESPAAVDRKSAFGSLRHLLEDLPEGWDSADAKAELTAQFEQLG